MISRHVPLTKTKSINQSDKKKGKKKNRRKKKGGGGGGEELTFGRIDRIETGAGSIGPFWNANQVWIFGMRLDMFFFILWPFESFPTKFTAMWLQWNVNADV